MQPKGSQKLAILLCRFKDTAQTASPDKHFFEELFVHRNTGGLNDYWIDASHGAINLDTSEVMGWKTLDIRRVDFINDHPKRVDKVQFAATAFDINIDDYAMVVAIYNESVGDGGNAGWAVLVQPSDLNLTFLAHETGHAFGLKHSFDKSSRIIKKGETQPGEYYDRNDIMSAMNVDWEPDDRFDKKGPLLNTANMERMGWLNPQRVWNRPAGKPGSYHVELVSLSHPEIPGYVCAKLGPLYIEFRTQEKWDKGIAGACVLIHEMREPNSVVFPSHPNTNSFATDWQPGTYYGPNDFMWGLMGGARIYIDSFDLTAKKAHIYIRYHIPHSMVDTTVFPDWNIWKRPPHLDEVEIHPEWNLYVVELENRLLRSHAESLQLNRDLINLQQDLLVLKQQKLK